MNFYDDLGTAMQNLTQRGAFLTVKNKDNTVNTMTISWGYIGFSWNIPHFITLVRPQRYTHELLENADSFTISVPYSDDMKDALMLCGSKSGRDINKMEAAKLTYLPAQEVASPIVDNCAIYYECQLAYVDTIHVDKLPKDVSALNYNGDYHDLYFGEIVAVYKK